MRCEQYCAPIHEDPRLTHIAAPLKTGGKSIGTLCVSARSPRSFSSRETDLLQGLASQAAIAIENARLHQQLRSLTLLEERERIAMELHDGIIQSIYAVGLNLERCAELVKENPREVRGRLEGAIDELNEVIKEIRNYIFNLRPASPGGKGLKEILIEASKVVDNNPSVQVEVIAEEIREGLSEEQVTQLGQIAKEALANVLKHARASSATLRVSSKDHGLALSILDNGVGFNPQVVEAAAGQGLRNMAERARVLGADFFIDSSQGSGTEIRVEIPLASERGGPGHGRKLDTSSHR